MNEETKRIILASALIFLVVLLQPVYFQWLGYNTSSPEYNQENIQNSEAITNNTINNTIISKPDNKNSQQPLLDVKSEIIQIESDLYYTTISNRSGGSIIESRIIEKNNQEKYKYLSYFDDDLDESVILKPLENNYCNPCLGYYNKNTDVYEYINEPFQLNSEISSPIYINKGDSLTLDYEYRSNNGLIINKTIIMYGDSYHSKHYYTINDPNLISTSNLELIWSDGLAPTEIQEIEDVTYGQAMIGQGDETETISITDATSKELYTQFNGNTDWASIRTKYFTASLLSKTASDYAAMSGESIIYEDREITPKYHVGIGYDKYNNNINASLYLGPLDIDQIEKLNSTLDKTMNFGFSVIRPIGKLILWLLKILHDTTSLNYGFCLIIFAIAIQQLTSPLTKKTYESSQKMQTIQPLVKKVQEKYKSDPQKMNQEVMKLYQEKGVNPLGGCLPLLLQMPLLWALFVVFRSTIEFRGAHFFFWITDLSQPDILFYLPFNIPLYGGHVALLPILMGFSIYLTQKLSMATMDPAQKPLMYIMNGFFILIFNNFPSGLNLYYTIYNLLNYYQQRSIRLQK